MGADFSFYVKTIETHARAFLTLNILAIGMVYTVTWPHSQIFKFDYLIIGIPMFGKDRYLQ